jgi:hypothetical protein
MVEQNLIAHWQSFTNIENHIVFLLNSDFHFNVKVYSCF